MKTTRLVAALSGAVLTVAISTAPAFSAPGDPTPTPTATADPVDAQCKTTEGCVVDLVAGTPGSGGGGGGPSASPSACVFNGTTIPCTHNGWKWSAERECYYTVYKKDTFTAEERAASAEAAGHPGESLLECKVAGDGTVIRQGNGALWWSGPAGGGPSPSELARQAVEQMALRAPGIGMTGGDPPEGMQIVGVPAWLWATDPGESTTGPITRSASAGAVTVEATGRLDRTEWSMGDGTTETCPGTRAPGTPWRYGYGGQPSPTCGHTYTRTSAGQPGEAFTVTVTSYWTITWSGGGQSGTIAVSMSGSIQKRVGEIQAIVVPGPGQS